MAETEQMLQTWPTVVLEGEGEHLIGFGEVEARTGFGIRPGQGIQYFLARGGLGYRLTERLSIMQGYGYHPGFQPHYFHENQIFQELDYQRHFKKLVVAYRGRFGERFVEHVSGVVLVTRNKLRFKYPIGHVKEGEHARLSAIIYDEYIYQLTNQHTPDVHRGFNENRAFIGIDYRWNERVTTEVGYLMQYYNLRHRPDAMNHVIVLKTNIKVGKILTKEKNPNEYDENDLGEGGD